MNFESGYLNKMTHQEYERQWCLFKERNSKEFAMHKFITKYERFKDVDIRDFSRPFFLKKKIEFIKGLSKLIIKESVYEMYKHTIGRSAKLDRPIFILGLPHSGTTIMMNAISGHPFISNMSEINSIFHPRDYFDMNMKGHYLGKENVTVADAERLVRRLDFYRRWKGNKPRFLNKNPNNTVTPEYLQEIFPDAFFVHVIRDPRGVINSIIDNLPDAFETYDRFKPYSKRVNPWPGVRPEKWEEYLDDDPFVQHAYQWKLSVDYLDRVSSKLNNYLEVRYEDVCSDPIGKVKEIWGFLDLPLEDDVLMQAKYVNFSCKNFKFQSNFNEELYEKINLIVNETMEKHNYS